MTDVRIYIPTIDSDGDPRMAEYNERERYVRFCEYEQLKENYEIALKQLGDGKTDLSRAEFLESAQLFAIKRALDLFETGLDVGGEEIGDARKLINRIRAIMARELFA